MCVEIVDCVSNALPDRCHRWAALNGGKAAKKEKTKKKRKKVNEGLASGELIWQLLFVARNVA